MPDKNLYDVTKKAKLRLPVGEHEFVIPKVSARVFLELQDYLAAVGEAARKAAAAVETTSSDDESTPSTEAIAAEAAVTVGMNDMQVWEKCCGPEWDRMLDVLDIDEIPIAGNTVFLWQIRQPGAADLYWANGGKAPAPAVEQPTAPSTPSAKTGDAATTTRARASTSGTRNPRKSAPAAKKAASGGRKSSRTAK